MIKNPFSSATKRFITKEAENQLYAKASEDMEKNIIHKGIWTRAFAKAEGNETKQKALYIELMVQHYKDEIRAGKELAMILKTEEERLQAEEAAALAAREAQRAERDAEAARIKQEEEDERKRIEYLNSPEGKAEQRTAQIRGYIFLAVLILIPIIFTIFSEIGLILNE